MHIWERKVEDFSTISVLQVFVNDILINMLGKLTIAYVDDILVYFHSLQEHVKCVLHKLLQNNLVEKSMNLTF